MSSDDKRLDVQGLRTVAIAAVLLFHFFPEYFPNGFLGVDIFFVISGFLIISILRRKQSFGLATFHDFYFRRMKRILPLYLVYILCAIILFTYNSTPSDIQDNQTTAGAAMLFATNLYALSEKDDYFKRIFSDNLFTHTWSLGVEVQFYLLAPFLFLFASHLSPSLHTLFFPFISVFSLILYILSPTLFSFNVVFCRLWQFLSTTVITGWESREKQVVVNGLAYEKLAQEESLLESHEPPDPEVRIPAPRQPLPSLPWCCLYWLACAHLLIPLAPIKLDPTAARIVTNAATALVVVLGDRYKNPLLSNEPTVFVGDISYSLYLFHWPFSVYFTKTTKPFSYERLSLIPCSLFVTVLVYLVFERYYRKWSNCVIRVFIALFYILAISLVILSPRFNNRVNEASLAGQNITVAEAIRQNQEWFSHPSKYMMIDVCNYTVFRNVSQLVPPLGLCHMPNGHGKLKFIVIGNSYTPNHADLIWKYFKPFFSSFTMFCQSACEVFTYTYSGYCKHLVQYPDVLMEFKPDVVFITQRYGAPKEPLPEAGKPDKQLNEMLDHMQKIYNLSSRFFIMDSFPAFNYYEFLKMNDMIKKNMTAEEINLKVTIRKEDLTARPRTKKLVESCKDKCRLYDVEPGLLDKEGRFCALDPNTSLSLFEPGGHLTPWGRKNIEYIYADLAKEYKRELNELSEQLYP